MQKPGVLLLSLFWLAYSLPAFGAVDCATLKARLHDLNPTKLEWREVTIPAAQIEASLAALEAPHTPKVFALSKRLAAIRRNPEKHFPPYLDDNYANCTMRRAELRTALVRTATGLKPVDPARRKITRALAASIKNDRKFPTLISAIADARVLEHGAEAGLWNASEIERKAIRALHQKIRHELAQENSTYGEPWSAVNEGLSKATTAEEKEKFLLESAAWKKVRAHILAEPAESGRHLRELRKLARNLK